MLPKPNRLRLRPDFVRVYRQGRSWGHPLLVLHVLTRDSGQRIGFAVGKKLGRAVERNRLRRRLREVVRRLMGGWRNGFDAVVVARAAAAGAASSELQAALELLARRAGIAAWERDLPASPSFKDAGSSAAPRPA
jgi:ribonuclease P protein component